MTIDSEYGSRNELLSKTWFGGEVDDARVEFDYDEALRQTDTRRYSDTTGSNLIGRTETIHDATGRRTRITHLNATDEVLANYEYEFNLANRITDQVIDDDIVDYDYDPTGQLLAADHSAPGILDEFYTYDLNGNRISSHLHGSDYVTGPNNQLLSDGDFDYEYDDQGNQIRRINLTTGEVTTYEYDHRNRMTKVTITDSTGQIIGESEFVFDVFGRRIAVINDQDGDGSSSAERESHVYDGDNVWADFDEAGNASTRYLFGDTIDSNIAAWRVGGTVWHLTDHLGSIRHSVGDAGVVIGSARYDSFGQELSVTNGESLVRFGFAGREQLSLVNAYYVRARVYGVENGRFTSTDPISFTGQDSNLYRYVGNAATYSVDPYGLVTVDRAAVSTIKLRIAKCALAVGTAA